MAVIRLRLWKVDRPTEADFPNPVNFLERLLGGAAAINGCQGWVASRASRGPTAVPVPAARGPSPRPPWADGDARRAEAPASGNSSARPLHRDADARPARPWRGCAGDNFRMADVCRRGARSRGTPPPGVVSPRALAHRRIGPPVAAGRDAAGEQRRGARGALLAHLDAGGQFRRPPPRGPSPRPPACGGGCVAGGGRAHVFSLCRAVIMGRAVDFLSTFRSASFAHPDFAPACSIPSAPRAAAFIFANPVLAVCNGSPFQ